MVSIWYGREKLMEVALAGRAIFGRSLIALYQKLAPTSMSIEDLASRQRRETTERARRHAKRQDDVAFLGQGGQALIGGGTAQVSSGSNGPFQSGQPAAFLGPGVVDVPSRVALESSPGRSLEAPKDCVLPGIMVYQRIVNFYRPNSYYGSFDSVTHYTERLVWFANNGSKTTLYERISAPSSPNGFPEIQIADNTHFWADTDGTGQVCFRYNKVRLGPNYDDIWKLTPEGATLISSNASPPNSQYKGGSLGVLDTSANPGYLLRENPKTIQNSYPVGTVGAYLSINGVDYPVYERYQTGARAASYIPTFDSRFCFYMPTMAGEYPIRYQLNFQPEDVPNLDVRSTVFTQNNYIAALVSAQTFLLQADGSYETKTWAPSTYILVRPAKLNIGVLGNFNQYPPLPIPPFAVNERYWISSQILATDIISSEGLGSSSFVVGSYLNASKNCLIKNSTNLQKKSVDSPFIAPPDPNIPI
jgi:hypothetical protein